MPQILNSLRELERFLIDKYVCCSGPTNMDTLTDQILVENTLSHFDDLILGLYSHIDELESYIDDLDCQLNEAEEQIERMED